MVGQFSELERKSIEPIALNVENCQVGVFAAYASPHGYCLLDNKLFIPEKWFTDEYAERREKCKFPENREFKTKPQLAADMFDRYSPYQIHFKFCLDS